MKLLDVFPRDAILYLASGAHADAVMERNFFQKTRVFADRLDHFFIEFCIRSVRAYRKSTVTAGIISVLFLGSPSKIAESAIKSVAIVMACVVSRRRPATNESFKNERMNGERFPLSESVQRNNVIPVLLVDRTAEEFSFEAKNLRAASDSSINGANIPKVRYLVKSFISNYCAPLLHFFDPQLGIRTDHYTGGKNA